LAGGQIDHLHVSQKKRKLDAKQSLPVAHPAIPFAACELLLIGQLIGSRASSATFALVSAVFYVITAVKFTIYQIRSMGQTDGQTD